MSAQRSGEILAVLQGSRPPGDVFDDRFLAAVPPEKLAALVERLQATNGRILGIEALHAESPGTSSFRIRFERATATARMTLDPGPPNKVGGFWIGAVIPTDDDGAKIASDFAALPGRAGFTIAKLGDKPAVVAGAHADEPFAIGSAFKLWVLDALAEAVEARRLRWDQVVPLGLRSLPSGITQDWPVGTPVTVATLATLMISRSDNTATDTLIRLIGRDQIDARVKATGHSAPTRMLPLLTTAEAFALKVGPPEAREAYAKADTTGRERILAALDPYKLLANKPVLGGTPVAADTIEWFASPADIARVFDSLRRRQDPRIQQILAVSPSVPPDLADRFAYVGFKGGSEPGVVDLSWLVRTRAGDWFVISASWNDAEKPVDEDRLNHLMLRLFSQIP